MFNKAPKIQIFVRLCYYSSISAHKIRPPFFSYENCLKNLLTTANPEKVHITFLLDTFHSSDTPHLALQQREWPVIEIKEGTETGSFLRLLEIVEKSDFSPETMIYFLEDDYLHRLGWERVLEEGLSLPGVDYVTLYDNKDKYFLPMYSDLQSKIFHTPSCHWRTTPSTTNTYAMKMKTIKRDLKIHKEYSLNRKITADHEKFCMLGALNSVLISPIPGWSTHMEEEVISPCVDWKKVQDETINKSTTRQTSFCRKLGSFLRQERVCLPDRK